MPGGGIPPGLRTPVTVTWPSDTSQPDTEQVLSIFRSSVWAMLANLSLAGRGIGNIVQSAAQDVEQVLDEAAVEGLAHQTVVIVTKHPVKCLAHNNKQILP